MNQAKQEYSASEVRKLLQKLFPHRRLVLSQFTYYNQCGVAKPLGNTYRRGRRCYRLMDILPIACVLALKEEGIPLKNIETLPPLIHDNLDRIFASGPNTRLHGYGQSIVLLFPEQDSSNLPLENFLSENQTPSLFWSFDIGLLARQLQALSVESLEFRRDRTAAAA